MLFSAGNELERFVSAIFERIARAQEAEPAFAAAALMFLLAGFGLFVHEHRVFAVRYFATVIRPQLGNCDNERAAFV